MCPSSGARNSGVCTEYLVPENFGVTPNDRRGGLYVVSLIKETLAAGPAAPEVGVPEKDWQRGHYMGA